MADCGYSNLSALKTISFALKLSNLISDPLACWSEELGIATGGLLEATFDLVVVVAGGFDTAVATGGVGFLTIVAGAVDDTGAGLVAVVPDV
jgi:hypothetical protein